MGLELICFGLYMIGLKGLPPFGVGMPVYARFAFVHMTSHPIHDLYRAEGTLPL